MKKIFAALLVGAILAVAPTLAQAGDGTVYLPLVLHRWAPTLPTPTPAPPSGPLVAYEKIGQVGGRWVETEVVAFPRPDPNQLQTLVKFPQGILLERWAVGSFGDLGFYVVYRDPTDSNQIVLRVGGEETVLHHGSGQLTGLGLTVLEETGELVLVWTELTAPGDAEIYAAELQNRQLGQIWNLGPGLSTVPPTINRRGTVAFFRWLEGGRLGVVVGPYDDPNGLYVFDSWPCGSGVSSTAAGSARSGALALSDSDDIAYFRFCELPPQANGLGIDGPGDINSLGWLEDGQLLVSSGTPSGTDSVISLCGRAGGGYHCYPLGVRGYQPVQVGENVIAYVSRREEGGSWQRPCLYWIFEERELCLDPYGQDMDWYLPTPVSWTQDF